MTSNLPRYLQSTPVTQSPPQRIETPAPQGKTQLARGLKTLSKRLYEGVYPQGRMVIRDHNDGCLWCYFFKPGFDWREWTNVNVIDDRFNTVSEAKAYAETPEAWAF